LTVTAEGFWQWTWNWTICWRIWGDHP